jgi:hypothetical protein
MNESLFDNNWTYQAHYSCTFDDNNNVISEAYRSLDGGDSTRYYLHGVSSADDIHNNNLIFNIYPNPVSGKFYLNSKKTPDAIEIFNQAGELIYAEKTISHKPIMEIDISGQVKGIYILKMSSGEKVVTHKIILQ